MIGSNYIIKRLVVARDITQAFSILKTKYSRCRIITYEFEKKFCDMPKEKRTYKNRRMWVWLIKDVKKIKEDF